jgi:hypothetical protein
VEPNRPLTGIKRWFDAAPLGDESLVDLSVRAHAARHGRTSAGGIHSDSCKRCQRGGSRCDFGPKRPSLAPNPDNPPADEYDARSCRSPTQDLIKPGTVDGKAASAAPSEKIVPVRHPAAPAAADAETRARNTRITQHLCETNGAESLVAGRRQDFEPIGGVNARINQYDTLSAHREQPRNARPGRARAGDNDVYVVMLLRQVQISP